MTSYQRNYFVNALETNPLVFAHLLDGLTDEEADFRPDPERFTLREVIAHLADWDPIWLERIRRTVTEDQPVLPDYDEGEFAARNRYDQSEFREQLARFKEGRVALAAFVSTLSLADWDRVGLRDTVGPVSVERFVALIIAHQAYHDRQVLEYRAAYAAQR
jgi:uncharacterized damage-inducible protein DinB